MLLAGPDGRIAGSVSGGCVEGAAYDEIERARREGVSRVIRYGISDEQAWDVGLACGGTIDVLVEPAIRPEAVAAGADIERRPGDRHAAAGRLAAGGVRPARAGRRCAACRPARRRRRRPARRLAGRSARSTRSSSARASRRPRRGHVADGRARRPLAVRRGLPGAAAAGRRRAPSRSPIPLVAVARELGYETVVVDGRPAFATEARFPAADRLVVGWPDEVADEIGLGPADAVAVLTHDVKFDEPAIVEALRRGCRYVGAVGSRKTQADRRARLLGGRRDPRRARPAARSDRAGPRRTRAGRDRPGDHGRDRRRAARRLRATDARSCAAARA